MADNMNNDRKMKEIISDAVDRQLDKEPELTMTPEKLKKRMAARKVERIKRRARNVGVAAALIVGVGAAMIIGGDFDVGANKNPKEEIITEDGVVIEDGGYGAEESNTWRTTEWEEVLLIQSKIDNLYIPQYIPNRYEFSEMSIEQVDSGDVTYKYVFANKSEEYIEIELFVLKAGEISLDMNGVVRMISTNKGTVYLQEKQKATMLINDGAVISIWSCLPDGEIVKIIENFGF